MKFHGDKSISHRALIIASLTDGKCQIHNIANGDDITSTTKCLIECGIESYREENSLVIYGGKLINPKKQLNMGNSGTTARLMMGLLAGQQMSAQFIGDISLSSRPMGRVIIPLSIMGAEIRSNNGKFPIKIKENYLFGIDYTQKIASAQVKSAILLAGLGADGLTIVRENIKSRNHTELLLKSMGADININIDYCSIKKLTKPLNKFEITIPGDPSSAAFFAAATALIPKKELILEEILINKTRIGFFSALKDMGVGVAYLEVEERLGELVGNIKITNKKLLGIKINEDKISSIIDELPILAILATQAIGRTTIVGAEELRMKETDRIHAIYFNLKNMGANIEVYHDGFSILGPTKLNGCKINTFDDHRIAMAFTIAGLFSDGQVILDNLKCVTTSCPEFYNLIKELKS